jgi:hypothetical protein
VQRLAGLDRLARAVQLAVELGIDAAAGEVDELAVEVGCSRFAG